MAVSFELQSLFNDIYFLEVNGYLIVVTKRMQCQCIVVCGCRLLLPYKDIELLISVCAKSIDLSVLYINALCIKSGIVWKLLEPSGVCIVYTLF